METEVGKWLQRDVNCLSDPQRMVRKRSLEKLSQVSDLAAKFGQDQLVLFFQAQLFKPLVQCIADPVEKCRELSLRTCKEFAKLGAVHGETMVNDLIHMMHTRVGKTPFVEAAEEIRLLILELLHAVIQTTPPEQLLPAEIMDILGKAATDPFPDAKRACCDATLAVAQKWKPLIKQHLGTVVKPHAMNLGHQHAKIRQCSLQALEAVVPCGSSSLPELMKDILLPNFIKVMFDRSPVVRKQLVQTTASWFEHIDELREFEAPLLPLFLAGLADESPDVQNHSLQWLDMLSKKWAVDYASEDHDMEEHDNFIESPPFKSRPPKGARLNAQRLLESVLPSLLEQCSDWTALTRQKSASILRILLILAEDAVNSHVDKILTALAKSCRDDETEVVESVRSCMNVVGRYSQTDLFFSLLLPLAAGRLAGQDTPHHRTNGLVLLSMGISGMEANRILPHMEAITETLSESGLRDTEVPEMQLNLAHLTASIVATGAPLFATHDTLAFRLFWVLSHLVASTAEDSVAHATALETLGELAKACHVDEEGLYRKFLSQVLTAIRPENSQTWTKASSNRILFDSLCRRGGRACGDQVHLIVPIILAHLDPSKEPDVRLAFLALLETMLGNELIAQSFQPFASSMLVKGITPNIVWQSGKVAATVRKVAMASTYTLLRQGLANQPALFESAPQMLPVLKSCLDDTDAKTRQLVCLSLQHLFVALPNALGEEPVSQLYHDILKRLDDSNDLVRKAACATYITFLRAAPRSHFRGTIIDYTMDALFVHLDDPDPEIQAAVFDVLRETFSVDPELLGKKAREHRTRHRSPYYCDQLIAL
ncbi:hypothetical protein Ae201684P_000738 [Aphanomyces euteiches]|uniref:TOG domain-containing protein n=1 Tax=Aphanomyces euteiches TaxID=100861 RepID=A0A6G0XR12_9STRA|nr:hypothetical protein Ae201684_002067 [Aphanomyces euteiches]KAH9087327.1 hypothetical protein Ae201684P_000738 [Aphanomyces euteiches]KAH9139550.1 hypothetical protein AeRB84_016172 [Aphanomyces euteiches]